MDKPVSRSTFLAAPRSRLQRGRVSGEERQKKDNDQTKGLEYTDQTIAEYLFQSTVRDGREAEEGRFWEAVCFEINPQYCESTGRSVPPVRPQSSLQSSLPSPRR